MKTSDYTRPGVEPWWETEKPVVPAGDYTLYYTSADGPELDATWSVYRERYVSQDAEEPIEGSQEYVATYPCEENADIAGRTMQKEANQ